MLAPVPCECLCRTEDVFLDASGYYWPLHDASNRLHVYETVRPKGVTRTRKQVIAVIPPPTPQEPSPAVVTVPTRREQLRADFKRNYASQRR